MKEHLRLRMWTFTATGFIWVASVRGGAESPVPNVPQISREAVAGKRFKFLWKSAGGGALNGIATLTANGTIDGINSPNESTWSVLQDGKLVFKHADGRVSTRFDTAEQVDGALHFEGPFLLREGVVHHLVEVVDATGGIARGISPQMADKIKYSNQQFVYLDVGESFAFRLHDGTTNTIRLASVEEFKDSVITLVRRAKVEVEVDGRPLTLTCAPNVMPTERAGLRILADTTSGWMDLPGRVQFSLWDAEDPIVDTRQFCFPLEDYSLFSHGIQAYNEPVHLGHRDGDPAGQRFYHNYGVDFAGFEGQQRVVSCIDGVVVQVLRQEGTLSIQDDHGLIMVFGHLDSILDDIIMGARVRRGQWVGMLGKRGASGNFSHLHVGTYLSKSAMITRRGMNRNLNLYPWLVAAYRAESGIQLQAVARPHHAVCVGETVVLDGTNSWAREKVRSYQWLFHDGASTGGPIARKVYDRPGCYMAKLRIEDVHGGVDVDFCRVKVFSKPVTEPVVPTLFVTRVPAGPVRPGQQIQFRIWPQGADVEGIQVDFGERLLEHYEPYSVAVHAFSRAGLRVVTARGTYAGMPITQQIKIVVRE